MSNIRRQADIAKVEQFLDALSLAQTRARGNQADQLFAFATATAQVLALMPPTKRDVVLADFVRLVASIIPTAARHRWTGQQ